MTEEFIDQDKTDLEENKLNYAHLIREASSDDGVESTIPSFDGVQSTIPSYDSIENNKKYDVIENKKDEASLFYGTYENEVSERGEADLGRFLLDCKKNPGHTKFISINGFNTNDLPEGYQDNDVVDFIKATADLTVRLTVKMTSTKRPELWPNSNFNYAFYTLRGTSVVRTGTGMVRQVNKYTEEDNKGPCQCHKCQHSDTPSKVWGEVTLYTATHVVFDDLEARHTTCRLFYDEENSPLVTLGGRSVKKADIAEDKCELTCETCDVDLMDKLIQMWDHWFSLWWILDKKYKWSRERFKMAFLVSHPHGCPKKISVGRVLKRFVVGGDRTKYMYTTCTCPGSSGAYVHPLGFKDGWLPNGRHVHTGVNSDGTNFGSTGRDSL